MRHAALSGRQNRINDESHSNRQNHGQASATCCSFLFFHLNCYNEEVVPVRGSYCLQSESRVWHRVGDRSDGELAKRKSGISVGVCSGVAALQTRDWVGER